MSQDDSRQISLTGDQSISLAQIKKRIRHHLSGKVASKELDDRLDDLAQETLVFYFRRAQEKPGSIERPKEYVLKIAEHVGDQFLRDRRVESLKTTRISARLFEEDDESESAIERLPDERDQPEKTFLAKETVTEWFQQIESLPEPFRTVMRLRAYEVSPKEIAKITGRAPSTIYNDLHQAKKHLDPLLLSSSDEKRE